MEVFKEEGPQKDVADQNPRMEQVTTMLTPLYKTAILTVFLLAVRAASHTVFS